MSRRNPLAEVYVATADPGYAAKGVGDLNSDLKPDIVWQGAAGDVWAWLVTGTTRVSQTCVGTVPYTGYRIVGAGDCDRGLRADIL